MYAWFCIVFVCVYGKNPNTPKLSPMADNTITRGGTGGLGSLVYICGFVPILWWQYSTIMIMGMICLVNFQYKSAVKVFYLKAHLVSNFRFLNFTFLSDQNCISCSTDSSTKFISACNFLPNACLNHSIFLSLKGFQWFTIKIWSVDSSPEIQSQQLSQ